MCGEMMHSVPHVTTAPNEIALAYTQSVHTCAYVLYVCITGEYPGPVYVHICLQCSNTSGRWPNTKYIRTYSAGYVNRQGNWILE